MRLATIDIPERGVYVLESTDDGLRFMIFQLELDRKKEVGFLTVGNYHDPEGVLFHLVGEMENKIKESKTKINNIIEQIEAVERLERNLG